MKAAYNGVDFINAGYLLSMPDSVDYPGMGAS
jgi:hypothetical protein